MSSNLLPDQDYTNCWNCRRQIWYTGGVDSEVPWVHTRSGNAFCNVLTPADAVGLHDKKRQPVAVPLPVSMQRSGS